MVICARRRTRFLLVALLGLCGPEQPSPKYDAPAAIEARKTAGPADAGPVRINLLTSNVHTARLPRHQTLHAMQPRLLGHRLAAFFIIAFIGTAYSQSSSYQGGRCLCQCPSGAKWIPSCPTGNECNVACNAGGTERPHVDYEAERRRRLEQERIQAEQQRQREQEEAQARFTLDRDIAARTLHGSEVIDTPIGLRITDNAVGVPRIKGDLPEARLRQPAPPTERNITGANAAWKQLHCSASILNPAIASLNLDSGRAIDATEFHYLANEALKALNGDRLGVACGEAPAIPVTRRADMTQYVTAQRRLVQRAETIVSKLESPQVSAPVAHSQQSENANPLTATSEGSAHSTGLSRREVDLAKAELKKIQQVEKKIERGEDVEREITSIAIGADEAPPKRPRTVR